MRPLHLARRQEPDFKKRFYKFASRGKMLQGRGVSPGPVVYFVSNTQVDVGLSRKNGRTGGVVIRDSLVG